MDERKLYFGYISLGFLYVAVKIVFVSLGFLHLGAIVHGVFPAALTVMAGFIAYKESGTMARVAFWNWVMLIFAALTFVLTPLYMYDLQGDQWLTNGRLEVLVIYEIMAFTQFVIATILLRRFPKST